MMRYEIKVLHNGETVERADVGDNAAAAHFQFSQFRQAMCEDGYHVRQAKRGNTIRHWRASKNGVTLDLWLAEAAPAWN